MHLPWTVVGRFGMWGSTPFAVVPSKHFCFRMITNIILVISVIMVIMVIMVINSSYLGLR